MEVTNFGYSVKNIPIPTQTAYLKKTILQTEKLCRRMRWRAYFYLNPEAKTRDKNTYGFNSTRASPQVNELHNFEKKLLSMIKNIKFQPIRCTFQKQLAADIRKNTIESDRLLVAADKTTNYYKLETQEYKQLLHNNITKSYRKLDKTIASRITSEAKQIANNLELDNRIPATAEKPAFITLKDHKDNFTNHPTCRLINPAKPELGRISKQILERINQNIKSKLRLNQWKNTSDVIKWFSNVQRKEHQAFIVFDIVEFYPSISAKLLDAALEFASKHDNITEEEKTIIRHAKKSILFSEQNNWTKTTSQDFFDVTMGSYDGAETCELVGSFILSSITAKYGNSFGLYRDDGLGVIKETSRRIEQIKKDLCALFKKHGLRITIEANKKSVDYLDITLDLNNGKYKPYNKPNNLPIYVHSKSNHPPNIIKNLPAAINNRLCTISSDNEIFKKSSNIYQRALYDSGYRHQLQYKPTSIHTKQRTRKRNITWYNPPFSKNVSTNIGKLFLKLIKEEFPEEHPLHPIFNKNTLKVSYCSMKSVKDIIDSHNHKLLANKEQHSAQDQLTKLCNCRSKTDCPLQGKCLLSAIIYQAKVSTQVGEESYIGLTETSFKARYNNHKASFTHQEKRKSTELSKHIWQLKDSNTNFNISWKLLEQSTPFKNGSKSCALCLKEKYYIIYRPQLGTLNKRNELVSTCRHAGKFLLSNFKT